MPRFRYDCALRWSDMDAFGHINNARFLTLYEEARAALMFLAARQEGITSLEAGTVIARHEVDYLRPVDYGEPVRIELWLSDIRNASFRVGYELYDDGVLASRATSLLVPYDLAAGRPRRLTAAERAFLSRWQDADRQDSDRQDSHGQDSHRQDAGPPEPLPHDSRWQGGGG